MGEWNPNIFNKFNVMSTVWWILWTIGIIGIYIGIGFTCMSDRKKVLMGWVLMSIGLVFNGLACLADIDGAFDIIMAIVSFGMAYVDYGMFKRKQKEFDMKELGIKESFLKDLKEYKFKLDRKNHKIV